MKGNICITGAALVAAWVGLGICGHARGGGIELPASGESLATYLPYADAAEPVLSDFKVPPMPYRPKTWWHWFNGMVSREGIVKDLQAMADMGIGGAVVFHLGEQYEEFHGDVRFASPKWFETWRFVLETAKPLGLEMGIHNCDGWSQSGGPWVTPETSMKQLVWTLENVEGNGSVQSLDLRKPEAVHDYYEDIAVVAWPDTRPRELAMDGMLEKIEFFPSGSFKNEAEHLVDGNPSTTVALPLGTPGRESGVVLQFKEPFTAASLVILPGFAIAGDLELSVSDDGTSFETVKKFQALPSAQKIDFSPVAARWWRLRAVSASTVQPNNTFPFHKVHLEFEELELLQPGEDSRVMPEVDDLKRKAGLIGGFFSMWRPFRFTRGHQDRFTVARDQIVRLQLDGDGVLRWKVPEGRWVVMRAGMTTTGKTVEPATKEGKGLEVDKLNAAHVQMHLDAYAKKMIEASGDMAGSVFKTIETDSWEAGILNWTQGWDAFFRQRNGYDLFDFLPVFANQAVDSVEVSDRFLFDLRRTYAEAHAYNYYGVIKSFCNKYGLLYESQSQANHQFIHDAVLSFRNSDIPMTEGPFRGTETIRGKEYGLKRGGIEAASAAHLFGKRQVSREAFTSIDGNWSHTPFSYKRAADAAFGAGVNLLVFHTYAHQYDETYPGWQMNPWGTALNRKLTWWPLSKSWFDYLGRTQYMLQQGRPDTDLLVFYGDDGAGIYHHGDMFDLRDLYRGNNHRFDVIDGDSLRNFLKVDQGHLVTDYGSPRYKLLVVMKDRPIKLETLEAIKRLADAGANILFENDVIPVFNPSLRSPDDARYRQLASELLGTGTGKRRVQVGAGQVFAGYAEAEVLESLGCRAPFSFTTVSGKGDVHYLRRSFRDDEKIWYFVFNHDRHAATEIIAEFRADAVPQIWHPETGAVSDIKPVSRSDGMTSLNLKLGPSGSMFVMFDRTKKQPDSVLVSSPVDEMPLDPPYVVRFDPKWGGPDRVVFDQLACWTQHPDTGIKYYSGIAEYEKEFTLPENWVGENVAVHIEFENIRDVAEIFINGKLAGSLWKPPFRVEITEGLRPGANTLLVKVANTWVNRCLHDATLPKEQRLTWANSMERHFPDENARRSSFAWSAGPLPSGIIGKVKLQKELQQVHAEGVIP